MKIRFLVFCLVVSIVNAQDNLVPQNINYTEFVGDIPNPGKDFFTPSADGSIPYFISSDATDFTLNQEKKAATTVIVDTYDFEGLKKTISSAFAKTG